MHISCRSYWTQKMGNSEEDYEDAYWPGENIELNNIDIFKCAVADGATEASFSGLWAQLLVQGYCENKDSRSFEELLPELQKIWQEKVGKIPLPWYAEQKLQSGAFSALVALQLQAAPGELKGNWQAFVVGDSCLFQIRDEKLVTCFPLSDYESFNNRPALIPSVTLKYPDIEEIIKLHNGVWHQGDRIYLMTDALAQWFLKVYEQGGISPWKFFQNLDVNVITFGDFVGSLRRIGTLKNDDVTLMSLEIIDEGI